MPASWKSKSGIDSVISRIDKIKSITKGGEVGFNGFELPYYITVIKGAIEFPQSISEEESRQILYKAIFETGRKGTIDKNTLINEVKRLTRKYLELPEKEFTVATALSIGNSIVKIINYKGIRIEFRKTLPKKIKSARDTLAPPKDKRYQLINYDNWLSCLIYVKARSVHYAVNLATNYINIFRGIWNWFINKNIGFRMTFDVFERKPINNIYLCNILTVHNSNDGSLASEHWWYRPDHATVQGYYDISNTIELLRRFTRAVRVRLNTINYEKDMEDALIRYTEALDYKDWNASFLRMWSLLEFLTNTLRQPYYITIKRASSVFKDPDYHMHVLDYLRECRNRSVHHARVSQDIEANLVQLKTYVEELLNFHMFNKYNFQAMDDAAMYLEFLRDKSKIELMLRKAKSRQSCRLG